jgi:hypothetical protein
VKLKIRALRGAAGAKILDSPRAAELPPSARPACFLQ